MMTKYLATAVLASVMISLLVAAIPKKSPSSSSSQPTSGSTSSASIFDRPFRLSVNDVPLNVAAKKRYPSPSIFDVDGDGNAELVIGDLMGSIGVHKNLNTSGAGDPIWGSRKDLKDVAGNPINSPNW